MHYWDGAQWVSALSADRRFRWNGERWVTIQTPYVPPPAEVRAATVARRGWREPTSWTLPLQRGVAAYFCLNILFAFSAALILTGLMSQLINQGSTSQSTTASEAEFARGIGAFFALVYFGGAVLGSSLCVVGIIAALKRWVWAYYAILVYVIAGMLWLLNVLGLLQEVGDGAPVSAIVLSLFAVGYGAASAVVFIWMLVALRSFGPWAMSDVVA